MQRLGRVPQLELDPPRETQLSTHADYVIVAHALAAAQHTLTRRRARRQRADPSRVLTLKRSMSQPHCSIAGACCAKPFEARYCVRGEAIAPGAVHRLRLQARVAAETEPRLPQSSLADFPPRAVLAPLRQRIGGNVSLMCPGGERCAKVVVWEGGRPKRSMARSTRIR